MTYRELYTIVMNREEITEDAVKTAQHALEKLDERNARKAAAPKKVNEESVALKGRIAEYLADGAEHFAKEIGEALAISTSKASGLCREMVKAGTLTSAERKVPKVGKRIAYTLAVEEEEE